jgi:hypothetical protein
MFLMIKIIIAISAVILLIYSHVAYAYKGYPQSMYWWIRLVGLGIFTGAWGMWSLLGYDTSTSSIIQTVVLLRHPGKIEDVYSEAKEVKLQEQKLDINLFGKSADSHGMEPA